MKKIKKQKKSKKTKILIQAPKGMHDILPQERTYWDKVSEVFSDLKEIYNFGLIETPVLEYADLFKLVIGEETDLAEKEMYILKTKGGELLALRPEGTAAIARAYVEHSLGRSNSPQRLCYNAPMFRHENPQAGRYREHHQIGFEILGGTSSSHYDAEIIKIFYRFLEKLKIKNLSLKINSIGCRNCRPAYERRLKNYYSSRKKELCADCQNRLLTNPLRLLDCKKETCQPFKAKAPTILDNFCSACSAHFKSVLEYLEELKIEYVLDNQLVRGLDYYNRTVFEIFIKEGNVALAGGGRYDYLIEKLSRHSTPAVGGALGIERAIEAMRVQEILPQARQAKRVFLISIGEEARKKSLKIIEELREKGISVLEDLEKKSLKSQLRLANKKKIPVVLIFGQKEVFEDSIILRNLNTSLQESVPLLKLSEKIKKFF